jgi:type II secretory pathway component PulF
LLRSVGQAAARTAAPHRKSEKALRYPLIILSLALLVVMGMLCFVLPEFAAIYQTFNTPLPWLTRAVISIGEGLTRCWPLLLPWVFYLQYSTG